MNFNKIYALGFKAPLFNNEFISKSFRFNLLANCANFFVGFYIKIFYINSEYYNNTVGVILTAAILYDFLFRASISFNMMFLEEIWSRNFTEFIYSTN